MAALFVFVDSLEGMADLLSVGSRRVEVCVNGPAWSLTIEYV